MTTRPLILIDCDGVLANFGALYLKLHHWLNKVDRKMSDITCFDFAKCVSTKEQDERIWRHIDATPGLVRELTWHDGSKDALAQLREIGHVVCVTSPHHGPTWMPERMAWLREEAGFDKADIIFARNKTRVRGDCLIDDNVDHVAEWHAMAPPHAQGILLARPWNVGHIRGGRFCASWERVVKAAREIEVPA